MSFEVRLKFGTYYYQVMWVCTSITIMYFARAPRLFIPRYRYEFEGQYFS